ncbi:PhnD/SsuA/transferrin family substrate-binding protein [Bacillaceae bacterium IKA-2]|nr:PhnD/SsuA/transferrin family substrate-binding protein [Bacillaceae bacterium IKA-2]
MYSKLLKTFILLLIISVFLVACGGNNTPEPAQSTPANAPESTTETSESPEVEETSTESSGIDRSEWPEKVRFAVDGIDGLEELQRRYDVFQEVITDLMGVEFELFPLANRTVVVTAMEFDQIDVGLIGPAEYVQMKGAVPGIDISAALQRDKYHAAFIVPEDSDLQTLDDLKGKKLSLKEVGSGSGHIAPASMLIEAGFDLDRDLEINFLGAAAIEALRSGEVDAMADGIRVYDKMLEEDGEGVWRLLLEGPPLPQDPFVVGPKLPESFKNEFKRVLIEHQDEILAAILMSEENAKFINAEIITITDSGFDLMRETYAILGIELN